MRTGLCLVLALALLAACSDNDGASSRLATVDAVAPVAATGPGCAGIHGDPPRAQVSSLSGAGGALYDALQLCLLRGGELLQSEDGDGTTRHACLHEPVAASPDNPLPLVVFLQGSVFPAEPQTFYNGFELSKDTADLTGDPARPGFLLLVPFGRDTTHFYPFPDDVGLGWDNWYRNFDRDDPAMNRDVQAIDRFIDEVRSRGHVDDDRVFLTGWSNGAAMAILYALNTPGIAATAVYSAPDPFTDVDDPCAQAPFGNNFRPIMTIHNDCDIIGICQTGSEAFGQALTAAIPQIDYRPVVIDFAQNEVQACSAACASQDPLQSALNSGAFRHVNWPYAWNERTFQFLRQRPL